MKAWATKARRRFAGIICLLALHAWPFVPNDCDAAPPGSQGRHWLTADAEHPDGDLHQNEKGSAVNTYATFAMLTGRNPHGRNFIAPGNTNDDDLMRYLSDMAFAEVLPRLQSLAAVRAAGHPGP